MEKLLVEWLLVIGWTFVGCVCSILMGFSLWLIIKIFDRLTPQLDEFEELKNGNMAVGVLLAGMVIAFALVVSTAMRLL